jgi:iron(II)-dependent oxidoreductase
MAGQVWEWTSSLWGKDPSKPSFKYPYDPADGRENLEAGNNDLRVLRGGAFYYDQYHARCASRNGSHASYRYDYFFGFRIVVSPIISPTSAL